MLFIMFVLSLLFTVLAYNLYYLKINYLYIFYFFYLLWLYLCFQHMVILQPMFLCAEKSFVKLKPKFREIRINDTLEIATLHLTLIAYPLPTLVWYYNDVQLVDSIQYQMRYILFWWHALK